jgi:hypothetical protein
MQTLRSGVPSLAFSAAVFFLLMGFGVMTPVTVKTTVFWNVTPCSFIDTNIFIHHQRQQAHLKEETIAWHEDNT